MTPRPPAHRAESVPTGPSLDLDEPPASGRQPALDELDGLASMRPANDVTRPRQARKKKPLPELRLSPSEERLADELVEAFMATVLGSMSSLPTRRPR